ncbi:EAL domain-containing protein [Acetobacteraceae bacterium ESL0709]|nr:EAL domain-containing protein [Acetobacteraceae bacterium ESL0697]MDF7678934.1 EAL domain-containing protein [Acetobacteraceae bacterium ESL0709]
MVLPGNTSKEPESLGDILTQYHGFLPFLVDLFKKLYQLNPIDPAISTIKIHILRRVTPFFVFFQLIAALCLIASIWKMPDSLLFTVVVFIGVMIIGLTVYLVLVREHHLRQAPAIYILRIFAVCLGIFWLSVISFILPIEPQIGQLLCCVFIMALMASAVLFLPVAGASVLFSSILGSGTVLVIMLLWYHSHYQSAYLIGAVLFGIYTALIILSCGLIRELLIGYLINHYYLEQRNAILTLLLGDTSDIAGDWLWETNAEGVLTGVSPAFSHVLGLEEKTLYTRPFVDIMIQTAGVSDGDNAAENVKRLQDCLNQRIFFRDLIVRVQKEGEVYYWSLSGRPMFKDRVFTGYRGVGTDVTHIHNIHRKASFRARHDELTNMPNRTAFFDDMEFYLVEAEQEQEEFALLNIDLDGFKEVNDNYGHHMGDYVLTQVVTRISRALEEADTLYRIGGDEFVLVDKNTNRQKATTKVQQLIDIITSEQIKLKEGVFWTPGVTIGIALSRGGHEGIMDLLSASDLALYEGKKRGGNCFVFFAPELETVAQRKLNLLRDLAKALDEGDISLLYQPFYDAQTQKLKGFEALLCWRHALYGRILTEQLISLAEDSGLIQRLGLFVLTKAAKFALSWPEELILSINLSPGQLMRKNFVSEWLEALDSTRFPAHRLQIEITETIFMKQSPVTFAKLYDLRERGMAITLDDFGKGFSCLGYLYFFPFSKIKMDRLFVRDMLRDQRAATIVKGVVNLTIDLGISLTIEGVESQEQYDYIVSLGCTEVQGFYFARPMEPEKVMELIAQGGTKKHIAAPGTSVLGQIVAD